MLDVAIRQTSSKLQEELKKKSTNDQKDYEKKRHFRWNTLNCYLGRRI